jgi:hypothetical protein
MAASLTAIVTSGAAAGKREPNLVVYFHAGSVSPEIVGTAEQLASQMMENVGVILTWRLGTPNYRGNAEVLDAVLTETVPEERMPGALAFATLGVQSGTRIEVFYNRVRASGPPEAVPFILAHVLVHEITHILEGVDRHSDYGVMKSYWNQDDLHNIRESLQFAPEDLVLIRDWAARHENSVMTAGVTARFLHPSPSGSLPAVAVFTWWPF